MCIRVSTLSANLIALPNNRDPTSTNLNICTEIAIEPPGSKTSSPGPPQIPLSGTITHRLGHVHTSTASEGAPSPPRNNPHAYGAAVHAHSNPPALPDSKRERKKKNPQTHWAAASASAHPPRAPPLCPSPKQATATTTHLPRHTDNAAGFAPLPLAVEARRPPRWLG